MTSKQSGETQDKELLDRYRRASDGEASVPSDAVRAAILAESRRVAEQLAQQASNMKQKTHTAFDTSRPAANDSRWKITAFGTLGAALLAALIIAPRYWETLPAGKASVAAPGAAMPHSTPLPESAPAPPASPQSALSAAESVAPSAASDAMQDVVVTGAKRRQADAQAELAAKAAALPPKDARLSNAPAPVSTQSAAAERAASTNAIESNRLAQDSASSGATARAYAPREDKRPPGSSPFSADSGAPAGIIAGEPASSTLLQTAAQSGNEILAAKLLDQGASVNARDLNGRTALMLAILQGRLEIVRLLLQRGADPNMADNWGETPLQVAEGRNFAEVATLLRNAGAR